jgi:ATP-dependent RNA circularization protein (DNA/RNA ligase family)
MGPGDHHCAPGQDAICTVKARDKHDLIIVQEKLDGSCVSAARIGDDIVALVRAGYPAQSSKYEQHQLWADWVRRHQERFRAALSDGERVVGEWLAQAHGTRYKLKHEPFVMFDIMRGTARRLTDDVMSIAVANEFATPHVLHRGGPIAVAEAYSRAVSINAHGAIDPIEGVVYRVEREGRIDFLAKWVRSDKADGCYLQSETGEPPVWNWRP